MQALMWFRRRGFVFWFMSIAGIGSLVALVGMFTLIAESQEVISFDFLMAEPDISLSISAEPQPASRNAQVTITIRVTNDGPGAARRIVLDTTLPKGMRFVEADPPDPACFESDSVVHCRLGALDESESTQVVIIAVVEESAPSELVTTGVVQTSVDESNTANNTASVSTRVE